MAPVIEVRGNPETRAGMRDNTDVKAGAIVTDERTMAESGDEMRATILAPAAGRLTRAEDVARGASQRI